MSLDSKEDAYARLYEEYGLTKKANGMFDYDNIVDVFDCKKTTTDAVTPKWFRDMGIIFDRDDGSCEVPEGQLVFVVFNFEGNKNVDFVNAWRKILFE